jgi:hypothetical protein
MIGNNFISRWKGCIIVKFLSNICEHLQSWSLYNIPSYERMDLLFTVAAGTRQRSHSQVHFTVSDSRLPQPGGPGPSIYTPQRQGGPVILPGTGFPFRRLLRLAGLRWRYSNPPPHEILQHLLYNACLSRFTARSVAPKGPS